MKLIFIYNAKSDKLSKALDFAHKIISPSTYNCDLCSLTHGNFSERKEWEKFRSSFKVDMEFYYKDNHPIKYHSIDYPVIIVDDDNSWRTLLNKTDLMEITGVSRLIDIIKKNYHSTNSSL